jgi:hypothetical protein
MNRTMSRVDFAYTRQELDTLVRSAHEYDVDKGGCYDARSGAINLWSHHWMHPATHAESAIIGSWYFRWEPPLRWEIETEEGFNLEDLMQELGRLELQALGRVKHGDVP